MRSPIAISSGHGKHVKGATPPYMDEVTEARRVVAQVATQLRGLGVTVRGPFNDDVSKTQNENLNRIVSWHNSQNRVLDVSVHFNANAQTSNPMGTECLYVTQSSLASKVASAMSQAGKLKNRGGKYRNNLYFLNNTAKPAILIETCFVDSSADRDAYNANFAALCNAIAEVIGDTGVAPEPPPPNVMFTTAGRCSWFGGPEDDGVTANEGLAFIFDYSKAPHLFLEEQPPNTTGLARRLNPNIFYVACRWDYAQTPKEMLAMPSRQAIVTAGGKSFYAWPADWGPHGDTKRVADLSPGLMNALGLKTDDEVSVTYPAQEQQIS